MDHSCHKCGNSTEDGKAFCSQCGAPQIRVAIPEVSFELPAGGSTPYPSLAHDPDPTFGGASLPPLPTRWTDALRPSALAASVGVVLMFLGLNPFVAALGAGFLAATFSQRRNPAVAVRPGAAAKVGALSGLLLFATSTILETLVVLVLHKGQEIQAQMMEKIQLAAARYPGPQVEPFLEMVKTPGGFAFMMAASLVFGLGAFLILGGLGGAVSAAVARKRRPG